LEHGPDLRLERLELARELRDFERGAMLTNHGGNRGALFGRNGTTRHGLGDGLKGRMHIGSTLDACAQTVNQMAVRSFRNRLRKLQDNIATYGIVQEPRPITADMTVAEAELQYRLTLERGPTPRSKADLEQAISEAEQKRLADLYAATLKLG
jgi:hypothetical protein